MRKIAIHMVGEENIAKISKHFNKPLTAQNCEFYHYLPDIDKVIPLLQVEMWHSEYEQISSEDFIKTIGL